MIGLKRIMFQNPLNNFYLYFQYNYHFSKFQIYYQMNNSEKIKTIKIPNIFIKILVEMNPQLKILKFDFELIKFFNISCASSEFVFLSRNKAF